MSEVGDLAIKRWLGAPVDCVLAPISGNLMYLHRLGRGGILYLVQLEDRFHHHIRRSQERKVIVLYVAAHNTVFGRVARIQNSLGSRKCPRLRLTANSSVLNIYFLPGGIHHRVQDHGPGPFRSRKPLGRQQVGEGVSAALAGQLHLDVVVKFAVCVQQIGRGHHHDDRFSVRCVEGDLAAVIQHGNHLPHMQGIPVAPEGAAVSAYYDGFLHRIGLQIIEDVRVLVHPIIAQLGVQLFRRCFGVLIASPDRCQILLLNSSCCGLKLPHGKLFCGFAADGGGHQLTAAAQLSRHGKGQGIAILFDGHIAALQLLREAHVPNTGGVGHSAVCFDFQGVVDLRPCTVFFVVHRVCIDGSHMQAVTEQKFLCVLRSFFRQFCHHLRRFGSLLRLQYSFRVSGKAFLQFLGKYAHWQHIHQ